MNRLKDLIQLYSRWKPLEDFIRRIETYKNEDFSICVENSKSLIESIGKEICDAKGIQLQSTSSINGIIKQAFKALGYSNSESNNRISSALATIAQCVGDLRNEIGVISHGKTLQELEEHKNQIDDVTKDFLLGSIELVSCLLINLAENVSVHSGTEQEISYNDSENFNQFWDDLYGDFDMGEYSFSASDILYSMDYEAYKTELEDYNNSMKGKDNEWY